MYEEREKKFTYFMSAVISFLPRLIYHQGRLSTGYELRFGLMIVSSTVCMKIFMSLVSRVHKLAACVWLCLLQRRRADASNGPNGACALLFLFVDFRTKASSFRDCVLFRVQKLIDRR
jgi:hypothetical protein